MAYRPGITCAMIVRDAAEALDRCLSSLRVVGIELAVVDTGSKDGSDDIALRHGAALKRIAWPGDFAAARNEALDMVETEWTLALDADEWFDLDQATRLVEVTKHPGVAGFQMECRNIYPDGRWNSQLVRRLWRTDPVLRLEGVIHEHLTPTAVARLAEMGPVADSGLWFWHSGYQERGPDKAARNLPLLEEELRRRPGQLYYECELAMTLGDLQDPRANAAYAHALNRLLEHEDDDRAPTPVAGALLIRMLQQVPDAELRTARTDRMIRLARGWFGESPGVLSMIGQIEIRRGDLQAAYSALSELERHVEKGSFDRTISVNPMLLNEHLFTNLALVAHQLGRKDVARRNYERLLALDPLNPVARQNLARL